MLLEDLLVASLETQHLTALCCTHNEAQNDKADEEKKRDLDIFEMSRIAQKWMCLVCVTRCHAEIYLSRQLDKLEK